MATAWRAPPGCSVVCTGLQPATASITHTRYQAAGDGSALHVIVFDEMDAVARQRGALSGDTTGARYHSAVKPAPSLQPFAPSLQPFAPSLQPFAPILACDRASFYFVRQVRDSVVNQLLAKMDGVVEAGNVLVIGLTNR